MYTVQQFKDEVQENGGFKALIAMYFNNSNVHTFKVGEVFDPATQLDEKNGVVKFEARDIQGKIIVITRKLEYLEGMSYAKNVEERDRIDLRTVRY